MLASTCFAEQAKVEGVRMWPAPDHTRVVFDISSPVQYNLFSLHDPERVVIDIRDARLLHPPPAPKPDDKLLKRIRTAPRNRVDLRVVLDLKQPVRPRSFLLKPNSTYGNRLVIDLQSLQADGAAPRAVKSESDDDTLRDVVICIDPGHGGEDPGATGPGGTHEKDVVLAIARDLKKLIDSQRGFRAVMTRTGDYYVGLRQRTEIARKAKADLFVSIHADAFRDPSIKGSSVYVLSRHGASSEAARWLAESENASDLVGGVSLDDKGSLLASVLLDLSQTATLSASADVASKVLDQLQRVWSLHRSRVERAGFVVLKSPDIPSILIETAYISNPQQERDLRNPRWQHKTADAILRGLTAYFDRNPPPGTLLAAREHVISPGETLSSIAHRYHVSVHHLRAVNGLRDRPVHVGEVLRIPPSAGS